MESNRSHSQSASSMNDIMVDTNNRPYSQFSCASSSRSTNYKNNKNVQILKSRGRPIKMYETEPFLSVDLLPFDKVCVSPVPSVSPDKPRISRAMLRSHTFSPTTSLPIENITNSLTLRNSPSSIGVSKSKSGFDSLERSSSNFHIKQPFKHSTNTPTNTPVQSDKSANPSRLMKARNKLATSHMNKLLLKQRQHEEVRAKGRLLKGKLKPLYPVNNEGPTINQCRGVISDMTSYTSSPSRTLQRRRRILSNYNQGNIQALVDRPITVESIHQTSEVSSIGTGEMDINIENEDISHLNDDLVRTVVSELDDLKFSSDITSPSPVSETNNKPQITEDEENQEKKNSYDSNEFMTNLKKTINYSASSSHPSVLDVHQKKSVTISDHVTVNNNNCHGVTSQTESDVKNNAANIDSEDSGMKPLRESVQCTGTEESDSVSKLMLSDLDVPVSDANQVKNLNKNVNTASLPSTLSTSALPVHRRNSSPRPSRVSPTINRKNNRAVSPRSTPKSKPRPLSAVIIRDEVKPQSDIIRPKSASVLKTGKGGQPKSVRFADDLIQGFSNNSWTENVSKSPPNRHVTVNICYEEPKPDLKSHLSMFHDLNYNICEQTSNEEDKDSPLSKSSCKPADDSHQNNDDDENDDTDYNNEDKGNKKNQSSSQSTVAEKSGTTQEVSPEFGSSEINAKDSFLDLNNSALTENDTAPDELCQIDILFENEMENNSSYDLNTSNVSISDSESLHYDADISVLSGDDPNEPDNHSTEEAPATRNNENSQIIKNSKEITENLDAQILDAVMRANSPFDPENDPYHLSLEEAEFIEEICDITCKDSPVYMVDPHFNKNLPSIQSSTGKKIYDRFQHKRIRNVKRRPRSAFTLRRKSPVRQLPKRPASAGPDYRKKLFGEYCYMCKHQKKLCRCRLKKQSISFENLYETVKRESQQHDSYKKFENTSLPKKSVLKKPKPPDDDEDEDEQVLDIKFEDYILDEETADEPKMHQCETVEEESIPEFKGGSTFEALEDQLKAIQSTLRRQIGIEIENMKKVGFLDEIEEFSDTGFSGSGSDEPEVSQYELTMELYQKKCLNKGISCLELSKHITSTNSHILLTDVMASPIQCLNKIYRTSSSFPKTPKSTEVKGLHQELNNLASGCFLQYVCDTLPEVGREKIEMSTDRELRSRESDSSCGLGLEIVATRKEIFSPTGRKVDEAEEAAPFAPLCFTVNAKPPAGYTYYFAYGIDLNPDRLSMYIKRKVQVRRWGILFGFNMLFNKKGVTEDDLGFPNIEFNPYCSVEGCVYELSSDELHLLDGCKGYPEHYEHIVVPVWMSGGSGAECNKGGGDTLGEDGDCLAQYCVPALTYIACNQWIENEKTLSCEFSLGQCLKGSNILSPSYTQYIQKTAEFT